MESFKTIVLRSEPTVHQVKYVYQRKSTTRPLRWLAQSYEPLRSSVDDQDDLAMKLREVEHFPSRFVGLGYEERKGLVVRSKAEKSKYYT